MERTFSRTFLRRAAMTLFVLLMTATTAWATDEIITGFTVTGGTGGAKAEEDYDKLMDGTADTKWCVTSFSGCYIEFQADQAFIPTAYYLATANDTQSNPGRNPKDWVLKAKKNFADAWTTLATVTNDNVLQAQNKCDYEFALSNTENYYRYFRFEVSALKSGSTFQLGELQIRGRDKKTSWEPGFDPTQWIQDVMVVGGSQSEVSAKIATYQSQGWTWNEQNLNAGNNGDVIYLLYKLGSTASPSHSFITQIYISDASGDASGSLNYQNLRYKLAAYDGSESFKASKGNLNNGVSGGDQIHLYYTTDKLSSVTAITHIIFNKTQSGALGKDGNLSTGYDLNNPGKGDKIYMHCLSNEAPNWTIEKSTDGSLCYVNGYDGSKGVPRSDIFAFPAIIEGAAVVNISGIDFSDFSYTLNLSILETIYFSQSYNASTIPSAKDCYKLKHVHIVDNSGAVVNADELPSSVTSIATRGFQDTAIETLKMPNVSSLGDHAFYSCSSLTSVTMPNVTSIGLSAFEDCKSMTSVTLPSGLTSIGDYAFQHCDALTSINNIPSSVTRIGMRAFSGCDNLTSATIKGNPTIGAGAFPDGTELKLRPRTNVGGGASWVAFYNDYANFKVQDAAKVFKATVSGGKVALTEVKDRIVNAGTAVVLKYGEGNNYIQLTRTTNATTDTQANELHGVNAPTRPDILLAGDYEGCAFYLPNYEGGMGYYLYAGDMMPQNTAFLALPPGSTTPATMPAVEVETLADNSSNSTTIASWASSSRTRNVMLSGRTLYKDGAWNTLCLPFAMTEEQVTAQLNPSALMSLSTSSFSGGTLTLNFEDATTIEAGKPYIIKWTKPDPYVTYDGSNAAGCSDIVNPIFTGVNVSNATANVETQYMDFIGITSPTVIYESGTDKHNLFLGSANTLYYPTAEGYEVNSCRAYFRLKNGLTAGEPKLGQASVRAFNLNFGDGLGSETGIIAIDGREFGSSNSARTGIYTLDGRKVASDFDKQSPYSGQRTYMLPKGVYIVNGKKVVIK